ncbi:hypothetical protein LTR37_010725 [Vermiconidia calcicola]|uniref:Uncharacterized protein n=1 Tax=Vermiconidia calcicola TaxID=1690605 RepID=A0ACC3N499_9PEZI|nr:hypothetical protein LTR37_010725 [Vermiconidia calcicola]
MRVALPVDPHRKTASEVATMEFLRLNTDIPVQKIIAHDSSNENVLGFEWILMEFIAGQSLHSAWREMPMTKKELLVKQLALYQSQLFEHKFDSIGNLLRASCNRGPVDQESEQRTPRGPFQNSHEWLSVRLNIVLDEQDRILKKIDDEDDIETAELSKQLAKQLLEILPTLFSQEWSNRWAGWSVR